MLAREHHLHVDVPEHVPMRGDPTRLAQALHNLLANAARYTPPGGEVSVVVSMSGSRCVTRVSDNGQGIAPESLERVFGLFEQEPGVTRNPSESGLGIGLTLARTMAELHGGSLTAHSEGRDKGAMFELVLPCGQPPPERGAMRAPAAQGESDLRVLVVDDNRDSADSMVMLLQQLGHDSRAVYDAAEALRVVAELDPALVLLDLNMPGDNGFEVIDRLREAIDHPLYIAAMTGYGQHSDRERTRAAGFDAHLTKPVSLDQLLALIRRAAQLLSA
jgi:CheY-like chemotaxis protein